MNISSSIEIIWPNDVLRPMFDHLKLGAIVNCTSVSEQWRSVANEKDIWERLIREKLQSYDYIGVIPMSIDDKFKNKQFFIDLNKSRFYSVFSNALINALGGKEKFKEIPYLNIKETRIYGNGAIELCELKGPLTVGHISLKSHHSKDVTRYTFLAIRFINREFNVAEREKDCNIWITSESPEKSALNTNYYIGCHSLVSLTYPEKEVRWTLVSGGIVGGWPTRFPVKDGRGDDFERTIEYVGRLVRGEPCGIRDICSPVEHSKITRLGTSTVTLS